METSRGTDTDRGGSIRASLAGRYATALFDIARDGKSIDTLSENLDGLNSLLTESADFRALTTSPLVGRADAAKAVAATADALALDPTTKNFLGVLANNGRLAQLPAVIRAFRQLAAAHRGEATAEVISAHPLGATQVTALKKKLKAGIGRDVTVELTVDPAILGGLIVKVGSRQIDSSIRTKLNSLSQAMKG